MIKQFNGITFEFDETIFKDFVFPANDTPFKGYSESIEAYNAGNIIKVIEIHIENITGFPANHRQIQKTFQALGIVIT